MLIADTYTPVQTMPLELWRKDMRLIADFANSLACPTPLLRLRAAVQRRRRIGLRGGGTAAVAAVVEAMAGLQRPRHYAEHPEDVGAPNVAGRLETGGPAPGGGHGGEGGVLRNERRTSCAHSPRALGAG